MKRLQLEEGRVWIGVAAVIYPSQAGGRKNWDLGGNEGVVPVRSRVVRRFDNQAEADLWLIVEPLNRFVVRLGEIGSQDKRARIDALARRREEEHRRSRPQYRKVAG